MSHAPRSSRRTTRANRAGRAAFAMLAIASALAASCSSNGAAPGKAADRVFDLGGGVTATLGGDGSLVVARGGDIVLRTPPGVSLFTRLSDPGRGDAWHDPTKTSAFADLALSPIPPAVVAVEAVNDPASPVAALHLTVPEQDVDTSLIALAVASDDGFYTGMGERFDHVNARGRIVPMQMSIEGGFESSSNDAHVPVPLLVSSRGYGVFVASREAGAFDVASSDPSAVRATFEGRALDVFVYVDRDPLAIVARFARQTGLPRPLPTWALSPMHWRNEWSSADAAIADATELRKRHIPASCLWIDNPWQTSYNTFRFDPARFADPPAMMQKLAALGFMPLAWSTPYLETPQGAPNDEAQQLYVDADAKGLFVKDATARTFVSPASPVRNGAALIDFTSDAARAFWIDLVDRATASGFRGYKIDFGEDLVPALINARLELRFGDGSTGRTARKYPIAEHAAYHASLDKAAPGKGVLVVRASSYGGATQADVVWPGDLDNDFEHYGDTKPSSSTKVVGGLPAAVVAAQTLAVSGFPAFGSDTGGFRNGKPSREALLRWAEHTALSVVLQLGGGGDDHDPWTYDEEAATIYAGLARLHQRLVPYLAAMMAAAAKDGTPSIRPLPLAYPSDRASFEHADDEYMLGPDLLVAPVIAGGVASRDVHLPPGKWIAWWDGSIHDGPIDLAAVAAPLGQPPLYVRAGALLPLYPDGIDTLVDATEPGVVTLASRRAEAEARAFVMGGARATFDDGASVAVDDGAAGVKIDFQAGAARTMLTIDLDLRARVGASGKITTVDGAGAQLADEAAVRASATSAWAIDAGGAHAWVRLVGGIALLH